MEILSGAFGEFLFPRTGGRSVPHFHSTFAIGLTYAGGGIVRVGGRAWPYRVGAIVVTHPFEPHSGTTAADGAEYALLYPHPAWLRTLPGLPDAPDSLQFDGPVIEAPPLAEALRAAFDRLVQADDGLLRDAIANLFRRHARATPKARPVPLPGNIEFIGRRIAAQAAGAGLSRAHYSRSYRKRTGLSPLNHRRQLRALFARAMIEAGHRLV